jgi:hypothetical protein
MNAIYSKQRVTVQYTEIVYYKDGEEIARERMHDDIDHDADPHEAMTEQEIEDWT